MGTLKSTLKLESTDLFPSPVSFTVVNNNGVNGSYSGFNTLLVTSGSPVTLAAAGSSGAFLYMQAATTNVAGNNITMTIGAQAVAELLSGDVAFLPIEPGSAPIINATTGTGSVSYFYGQRI